MTIDGAQPTTLVFDVLGTVVDEDGSVFSECRAVAVAAGLDLSRGAELATAWQQAVADISAPVHAGVVAWRSQDDIATEALARAVDVTGFDLDDEAQRELALIGHRLQPWPDAVAALTRLAPHFRLVALSNGNLSMLVDLSRRAGLPWDCILSGQLVHAYKPNPLVYQLAVDLLELVPDQTLMVAAHPWDLRGAAAHGLRTAYIARAGEGTPADDDHFDVYADDLADLAARLT